MLDEIRQHPKTSARKIPSEVLISEYPRGNLLASAKQAARKFFARVNF
jgi:hypothetical protein